MNKNNILAVAAAVLAFARVAAAGTIAATPADQPIVPGVWHQSLTKALAMAQETGIPVVGFWANTGCDKCAAVIDRAVNTPEFTAWRQQRQLLMVTGEGKSGLAGELYTWVRAAAESDGETSYPFIRIFWVQRNGTVRVDTRFSGYPYRANAQTLINKIESYVAPFSYAGQARFACTPGLEMEPDTPSVPLPLVRINGSAGTLTNTLTFVRTLEAGGSSNWTETVVWADGELSRTVTVANEGHTVGGSVTLTLSGPGEADQTAVIALVAEREVSTTNPRFLGEPFAFGEWTMDLAAATNAVAATNVPAYTLVFFTGALWCPYCMGMDRDWLSQPAFKEFVRTNTIALVEIDNYRRDGSAPTLLRYDVYQGPTNDTRNGHSGAGYLSRHGISAAAGEAALARNQALQAAWTLPGATRIGYPTLILLRKDGTLAGRTSGSYRMTDNTVVPAIQSFDLSVNMLRLQELLELARDPLEAGEERNGAPETTGDALEAQGRAVASLRTMDAKDVYALRTAAGLRQTVSVSGAGSAGVQVAVLNAAGLPVRSQGGLLTNGVSVTADIAWAGPAFAAVTASGAVFQVSNPESTVRPYVIETRYGLAVSEAAQTLEADRFAAGGVFEAPIAAVSNTVYRFVASGAALTFPAGGFEPLGGDLYRAGADGDAALRLTSVSAGDTFTWQVWNPGTVGFTQSVAAVSETATNVVVAVRRSGGVSGPCSVTVSLDAANTTAAAGEDFVDVFGAGAVLSWADGEAGTKTLSLPLLDDAGFEGDEVVALTLAVTAGAAALAADGAGCRVTIVENDQPVVGRLAFAAASVPYVQLSPLTIVAREGGSVSLGVERVEGASTAISAHLAATAGTLAPDVLAWGDNDRVLVKTSVVALPLLSAATRVSVTLTPDGAVQAVPGRAAVAVHLIAADAPVFAQAEAAFAGRTRVAFDQRVAVLQTAGGRVGVDKRRGSLPSGVEAKVDPASGALRLTGVPKQAGVYTAVYQLWELRGQKKVAGGAVQVTITVTELGALNAAAASSVAGAEGAVIDAASARVAGTLSLSVTQGGRLTAKYLSRAGTVTFSGSSWSACDEADGSVTAELSRGDYRLTVRMTAAGALAAAVSDPGYAAPLAAELTVAPWSAASPATDYEGYYTVSLSPGAAAGPLAPTGYSYMTVSLRSAALRTGKLTYAGKLADGTSYSGSAVLQPIGGGAAQFVVFQRPSRHVLACLLSVAAHADETYRVNPSAISACGGVVPYWTYGSGYVETSFDIVLDICGGYYNSADSLLDYYNLYSGAGPMALLAAGEPPVSAFYGSPLALPAVEVAVTESTLRIPSGADNPLSAQLSLAKATGLFRGFFKIPFVNAASELKTLSAGFAGVLLPGWTGDCGCGEDELDLPEKPFGMGAFTFRDQVAVDVGGEIRARGATRGFPMILKKLPE